MAERVWMVHPDLPGQRISCAPSGVGARQASGWTVDETQDTPSGGVELVAPAYVHRLLDVFLRGGQLDIDATDWPVDVRERLEAARAGDAAFLFREDEAAPATVPADDNESEE